MSASRYLSVNVYPASDGWKVAVLLREAGRPYPRLVRTVLVSDLPATVRGLPGALEAAAGVLAAAAEDLERTPVA